MRQSISPQERLTATLRFLAAGRSYEDLKFSVAISPPSYIPLLEDNHSDTAKSDRDCTMNGHTCTKMHDGVRNRRVK
ncbi:unnamed protein product [Callosobruchus maculatus]|uniref:Uncharacterized protein n=1 Tax=Callosobruchus maculatus TaxID=64391 RepID=A0A653BGB9_CALMS|nr:unnamed protein product [Callosobruchus maculatus]